MVLNNAYLVDCSLVGEFQSELDALTNDYSGFGFEYEAAGPWPPYSFANRDFREHDRNGTDLQT